MRRAPPSSPNPAPNAAAAATAAAGGENHRNRGLDVRRRRASLRLYPRLFTRPSSQQSPREAQPSPLQSPFHSTPHRSVHNSTRDTDPRAPPSSRPPPAAACPRHLRGMPGGRKRPAPFAGFSPFARSLIFSAAASSCPKLIPLPDASTSAADAETPRQGTLPLVPARVSPSPLLESRHSMHASLAHQTTCRGRRPSARSGPSPAATKWRTAAAAEAKRRASAPAAATATTAESLRRR